MKTIKQILLFCTLIASPLLADDNYQFFTSKKGDTVEAELLSFREKQQIVVLRRRDKKIINVPLSRFADNNQIYILSWTPETTEKLPPPKTVRKISRVENSAPREKQMRTRLNIVLPISIGAIMITCGLIFLNRKKRTRGWTLR